MNKPTVCEYGAYNEGDGVCGPCTGPTEEHDCSFERELADDDEAVKRCHCCTSCARECYCNV